MAQTSVHLKACDIAASETHNKREKELDYVRKDLTQLNESFSYIPHSLQTELADIRRTVKEKTGRKLQKNAVPIKEGVVVIDDKTTMADLQRYCDSCREKFGIVPLQIHIHRDEGHAKSKEWKPNLHAHIVWSMYDENGRNVRLSKQDCRDMQTLAANVLDMERGKSSDKKHLDALCFKIEQQEKRIKELEEIVSNLSETQERAKGAFEGAKQGVSDLFTGRARKRAEEAEKRATEAKKREEAVRSKAKEIISIAQSAIKESESRIEQANARAEKVRREWNTHKQELQQIEDFRQRAATAEKKLNNLERRIGWRERMIEKFIEYGAVLSDQWNKLFKGEIVQTNHIQMNGVQVPLDNPIGLRLDKDDHFMIHDQHWVTEQGFWNGIRKGLTNAFNRGSEVYSWVLQHIGGNHGMKI